MWVCKLYFLVYRSSEKHSRWKYGLCFIKGFRLETLSTCECFMIISECVIEFLHNILRLEYFSKRKPHVVFVHWATLSTWAGEWSSAKRFIAICLVSVRLCVFCPEDTCSVWMFPLSPSSCSMLLAQINRDSQRMAEFHDADGQPVTLCLTEAVTVAGEPNCSASSLLQSVRLTTVEDWGNRVFFFCENLTKLTQCQNLSQKLSLLPLVDHFGFVDFSKIISVK